MDLDTMFWIASCTKLMTTIAALQCVERGLFSLDSADDVRRFIPELATSDDIITGLDESETPVVEKATRAITLRHLLTHTSGVAYDASNPLLQRWRELRGQKPQSFCGEVVRGYLVPLLFNPGDGWRYGASLDWAGLMIERANEGKKLGQFMKQNIWDPLGMASTTFHPEEVGDIQTRLASMSVRLPSKPLTPFDGALLTVPAKDDLGGAGAYSSASDYIKVLASILRDDKILLKRESVQEMFTPQLTSVQKAAYTKLAHSTPEMNDQLTSGVKIGTEVTWGLGGVIIEEDIPDGRKEGSLYWSGMPNLHWVSEEAKIHVWPSSQIVPVDRPYFRRLWTVRKPASPAW